MSTTRSVGPSCWCGQLIPKGERHYNYQGMFDGEWQNWRMHEECHGDYEINCDPFEGFSPFENERPVPMKSRLRILPLFIELFAGLHGWGEGAIAEGFSVIGFDIEDMCAKFGYERPRGIELVIQDVLTLHGSQFKYAAAIVASPPCQGYSYRAMPWKRAKDLPPPSNELFDACFRIQREACEAAGRHIPMVVENVRGAQKWVGRAAWHFGSYFLWGDVPALMPITLKAAKVPGFRFDGNGGSFQSASVKVAGLDWSKYGEPDYKAKGFNVTAAQRFREGVKQRGSGREWFAGEGKISRMTSSKSDSRKAASAAIAKIPFPLSLW